MISLFRSTSVYAGAALRSLQLILFLALISCRSEAGDSELNEGLRRLLPRLSVWGPTSRQLFLSTSSDLTEFTSPSRVATNASSPQGIALGQEDFAYFVRDGMRLLRLNLRSGAEEELRILEENALMRVDPHVVVLSKGDLRLYYIAQRWPRDPGRATNNEVHSARSSDGVTFRREPGVRLRGAITDPDVVALEHGWRMYVTEGTRRVRSAFSTDGLQFSFEEGTRVEGGCVTSTVRVESQWRMYHHRVDELPSRLHVATSADGLAFLPEGALPVVLQAAGLTLPLESPSLWFREGMWRLLLVADPEKALPSLERGEP